MFGWSKSGCGLWCVLGAMRSVPDGAQQWCISWKCWIPCCFHNEVVADCAVVVDSWLYYTVEVITGSSTTCRWPIEAETCSCKLLCDPPIHS